MAWKRSTGGDDVQLDHWFLGRADILVLEEVRKGEEGEEKLFSTLAALALRTLAGGPERRQYRTVADR